MKFKIIANQQTPAITDSHSAEHLIFNKDLRQMLIKFLSFASRQKNCVGLAANQVSCDGERIMERFFAIKVNHWWDIVIDPQIIEYKGNPVIKTEGCLTWLGRSFEVRRYPEIRVRYYNLRGEEIGRTISGFEAQVWQHEYNHLEGVEEIIK